jgi:hypothetical protein
VSCTIIDLVKVGDAPSRRLRPSSRAMCHSVD